MTVTSPAPQSTIWPTWVGTGDDIRAYRSLAAYASRRTLDGLGLTDLTDAALQSELDRARREATDVTSVNTHAARRLYDAIASRKLHYRHEAWSADLGQRIRDPRWIDRVGGTCLDLALLYVTMALEAGITTLLAIGQSGQGDHAFVLVDTSADTTDRRGAHEAVGPEGVRSLPTPLQLPLMPLDVTGATRDCEWTFDEAVSELAPLAERYHRLVAIDVAYLQNQCDVAALDPPAAQHIISRRLPPRPDFEDYASRRDVVETLNRPGGPQHVVLAGPQGVGKSMLAHRLAAGADEGCGWFLTASDADTLIAGLAEAYTDEEGVPAATDDATRKDYARSAVRKLNDAVESWVVVLDNANGYPADLRQWVPRPRGGTRQRVIVTTTNPAWAIEPAFTDGYVDLAPLSERDITGRLGDRSDLVHITQGRPLLLESFVQLVRRLGADALAQHLPVVDLESDDAMDGPRAVWQVARSVVGPDARRLAQVLAWLPPDDVPVSDVLTPLVPDAAHALDDLRTTGVIAFRASGDGGGPQGTSTLVSTHRLYLRAVRDDPGVDGGSPVEVAMEVVHSPGAVRHLDNQADRATLDLIAGTLREAYAAAGPAGRPATALKQAASLLELHGRIAASAECYDDVASRLLDDVPGDLATGAGFDSARRGDYDVLADCLHGRARRVFQQERDEPDLLRKALVDCEHAVAIKVAIDDKLGAARSDALRGLILRELANSAGADKLDRLREALDIIRQSADDRELLGGPTEEVARSIFNIGGSRIQLAKTDDPESAEGHLVEAARAYGKALKIRLEVYRRPLHPHIAACRNGLALVGYYRALIVPHLGRDERRDALREATAEARQALEDRQEIDGPDDGADTQKSATLLAKILLARLDLARTGLAGSTSADALGELTTSLLHTDHGA